MPITFYFRPEHNLVILVHVGTIPNDEFLAFYRSLIESSQYNLSMNLLIDLRQTDSAPRSREVLRQLAEYVNGKLTDVTAIPKAAVVAPNAVSFGMARMYEAFAYLVSWDFKVFHTMNTALAWLSLPEDLMDGLEQDAQ